jgi:tyrosyl-tRNA synthetase
VSVLANPVLDPYAPSDHKTTGTGVITALERGGHDLSILRELEWRGLLHQTAGADIEAHLAVPNRGGYCGFDPTSDSLTIGNFIPIKLLMHWQRAGHRPIVVMGGGTGLIGDPSGKDSERQLLTREQVEYYVARQMRVFEKLLDFGGKTKNTAVMVNNVDWLDQLSYLEVLREVGKHFSVNTMIQRDSVRDRLHNRDQGISYTEFSYMVLQAYDFLHLFESVGCTVQIAGSDQYGNIVAGMDLIRRKHGAEKGHSWGITAPLLLAPSGKKIGKTEEGAIWLTKDRTSPYRFYQYWINIEDADVGRFLRWFTFLTNDEITALEAEQARIPHERPAQRALAREMTTLLHGTDELRRVEQASEVLFGGAEVGALDAEMLGELIADVPHSSHNRSELEGEGKPIADLLAETTLASSKRQAREFLGNGAVFLNGVAAQPDQRLHVDDLLHGGILLLRRGKKSWHATRWE